MSIKPYKTLKIRRDIECPFGHVDLSPYYLDCRRCEYFYQDGYISNCFLHDLMAYLMYRVEEDNGS